MSDILTPSEQEIDRLFEAFSKISSMHSRMKVLDLVEKLARERPRSRPMRSEPAAYDDEKIVLLHRQG